MQNRKRDTDVQMPYVLIVCLIRYICLKFEIRPELNGQRCRVEGISLLVECCSVL